LKKDKKDQG